MMNMNLYLLSRTSLTKKDIDEMFFHEYKEYISLLQEQDKKIAKE